MGRFRVYDRTVLWLRIHFAVRLEMASESRIIKRISSFLFQFVDRKLLSVTDGNWFPSGIRRKTNFDGYERNNLMSSFILLSLLNISKLRSYAGSFNMFQENFILFWRICRRLLKCLAFYLWIGMLSLIKFMTKCFNHPFSKLPIFVALPHLTLYPPPPLQH